MNPGSPGDTGGASGTGGMTGTGCTIGTGITTGAGITTEAGGMANGCTTRTGGIAGTGAAVAGGSGGGIAGRGGGIAGHGGASDGISGARALNVSSYFARLSADSRQTFAPATSFSSFCDRAEYVPVWCVRRWAIRWSEAASITSGSVSNVRRPSSR